MITFRNILGRAFLYNSTEHFGYIRPNIGHQGNTATKNTLDDIQWPQLRVVRVAKGGKDVQQEGEEMRMRERGEKKGRKEEVEGIS